MDKLIGPLEAALRSGSRSKNFSTRISDLCASLPENLTETTPEQHAAILKLAGLCRSSRAVSALIAKGDVPAIDQVPDFNDLFCVTYYPVMEDGKRSVGFWSVKDVATLAPADVHEWVLGRTTDKKTGKTAAAPVPFATWWGTNRPDYELYGLASDRAMWDKKVIDVEGRRSVNTSYGKPPVLTDAPEKYGDGSAAERILDLLLERTITDEDPENASRKRQNFVLDAGAHLLALRDFRNFRCTKLFCFTSTNGGQGTGKSILQEAICALVPRGASVTVPATEIAGRYLLPLYESSVCVLKEAPPNANERYTAEDVKDFTDVGWKTADNKFVPRRTVKDNSLKLLSSNHLAPLPIDSDTSRRVEFFISIECRDNGRTLIPALDEAQERMGWSMDEMRACVGWALLLRASRYLDEGGVPCPIARRTIDAKHLLSPSDYDYFVNAGGAEKGSYTDYRDARSDKGFSWSPDAYRYEDLRRISTAREEWVDGNYRRPAPPPPAPPDGDDTSEDSPVTDEAINDDPPAAEFGLQYKRRMSTAYLEPDRIGFAELWRYIMSDDGLRDTTTQVRMGTLNKRDCLRQVFPGALFNRFTRTDNIESFTGLVHVDFDHVDEKGGGLTADQVRDALAELPGFVIGALSSGGKGAWAIFNAGDGIKDYTTYMAAERSLFAMTEDHIGMPSDHNLERPTTGRTLGHDVNCRIADEALGGVLPAPFEWKAPTFAVKPLRLTPTRQCEETADEKVRNERFMEVVVDKSCERIQNAIDGERHGTAVKAVANVVLTSQERGVQPLSSWGRRLRDACLSCGLDAGETNGIMLYWRQKTGLAG